MAMYEQRDETGGMSVFLRDEPEMPDSPESAPPPPSQGSASSLTAILVAVLAIVVAGGAAAAWYVYKPQVDLSLRTPVTESHPYQESVAYLQQSETMRALAGDELQVSDAGDTIVDWNISGEGHADIHLDVVGPKATVQATITWKRSQNAWLVTSASYRLEDGPRHPIPLGKGDFLTPEQMDIWNRADTSTLMGRGQREFVQGQHIQAIGLFTEAMKEDPEDVEPLYWRGRTFEALGNSPKAIADYQRLLTVNPEHDAALARLDAMRASPPPGQPKLETPDIQEKPKKGPSPVSLIPR